jgi:hypothetical protein
MDYLPHIKNFLIYSLGGGCIGAISLPIVIATVPFALGFTVGGIASGSLAAMCMAFHAGYTPIGGFVATMQRIGTMGMHAGFNMTTVKIGGICGIIIGIWCYTYTVI